ncbi:hypothetical protein SH528x_003940 [Novipirellula sp. SH528]|uniref:hypothetical protein n=1 Tax=Novipirellula sp. SH528 TaxID=3454466 RepID=UPI003FA0A369
MMKQSLHSRANIASVAGSIMLPVILLIAYALVWANDSSATSSSFATPAMTLEIVMEFIAAAIVGSYVGRGVYYGFLGTELSRRHCKVNMILGHSDQACGLRPIGDFYFLQALIVALPVAFFAFWAVMMPVWTATWPETHSNFTTDWQGVYVVFLVVAILLEFASFVFPLLSFHRQMKQQKQMLLPLADKLSAKLSQLQWKRTLMMTGDDNSEIEKEFDGSSECGDPGQWIEQIGTLESLPTWPIAPSIRNRFAAGNMVFLIPAAFRLVQYLMNAASAGLPLSPT